MSYLIENYWMWSLASLFCGGAIGYWWLAHLYRVFALITIAIAIGLISAVWGSLPELAATDLEPPLLLLLAFFAGLVIGGWLRSSATIPDALADGSDASRSAAVIAAEVKAADEANRAAELKAADEARAAAAKAAEQDRLAAEAKAADEARVAAAKAAEDARRAAEAKAEEEAREAASRAAEEARRAADAKAAEEAREAASKAAEEKARRAAEAKATEEARVAAAKVAEEARRAAEARSAEEAREAAAKAAEEGATAEAQVARDAHAGQEALEAAHPGVKPAGIAEPRDGKADDLKLIKGIGPKNEVSCNNLGVYHLAQIADWTPDEATWVGHHLAFPGRIEREHWIDQAKLLAVGGDTEHSAGIKAGTVQIDATADAPLDDAEAAALHASLPAQAEPVEGEAAHHGRRPYGLLSPRHGGADNLQRIRGIGPQNERRLQALGIWHFSQIAAWSAENVSWIGSYLAFPGRIDREKWISQATDLAAGRNSDSPTKGRRRKEVT